MEIEERASVSPRMIYITCLLRRGGGEAVADRKFVQVITLLLIYRV